MDPEAKIDVQNGEVLLLERPIKPHELIASLMIKSIDSELTEQLTEPELYFNNIRDFEELLLDI